MAREQLIRQWRLIELLMGRTFGVSVQSLLESLQISKATLYRDFEVLAQAGVPLVTENRNNEAWYRLEGEGPPSLRPTPAQMVALVLARTSLQPLEGTRLVDEYDALLARWQQAPRARLPVSAGASAPGVDPALLRTLEDALFQQRQLRFFYENAQGIAGERLVDPLMLRLGKDNQLFLDAFDTDEQKIKTYKPARMTNPVVEPTRAASHPEYCPELFANAIKTWSAPPVEVEIQISPRKARFLREWPLHENQMVEILEDGSARVIATVAGLEEVGKWVLSWGRDATVLRPPELRRALRDELREALAGYPDETAP